jgi:hypothetical protein
MMDILSGQQQIQYVPGGLPRKVKGEILVTGETAGGGTKADAERLCSQICLNSDYTVKCGEEYHRGVEEENYCVCVNCEYWWIPSSWD